MKKKREEKSREDKEEVIITHPLPFLLSSHQLLPSLLLLVSVPSLLFLLPSHFLSNLFSSLPSHHFPISFRPLPITSLCSSLPCYLSHHLSHLSSSSSFPSLHLSISSSFLFPSHHFYYLFILLTVPSFLPSLLILGPFPSPFPSFLILVPIFPFPLYHQLSHLSSFSHSLPITVPSFLFLFTFPSSVPSLLFLSFPSHHCPISHPPPYLPFTCLIFPSLRYHSFSTSFPSLHFLVSSPPLFPSHHL